jgi:hypothetical protein
VKVRSKKFKADLTAPKYSNAISYQISIRGPRASKLTKEQANELVENRLEGTRTPFEVRIKVWRNGQELNWEDDNPRAIVLRENIRRALQAGKITLRKVGNP